ncbi:DUF1778 domain-containing protein [Roseovarius tibetensis]|uniref:type II toxin -antitoxin system TacA 1-like antitoxin n=1 Tax=Roseovarius tibetensis TaxID=2685897 RepID=UPI003D7F7DD8
MPTDETPSPQATDLLEAQEHTRLEDVDHAAFFAALDAPAEPGAALVAAAGRYKARVAAPG